MGKQNTESHSQGKLKTQCKMKKKYLQELGNVKRIPFFLNCKNNQGCCWKWQAVITSL